MAKNPQGYTRKDLEAAQAKLAKHRTDKTAAWSRDNAKVGEISKSLTWWKQL